jgi:membrane-bound ClpP family serine protease
VEQPINLIGKQMRFSHINNVTIIAVLSFVLAVIGFILDLHERVQDVKVNIFETLMITAIIFTALSTLYVLGFVLFKILLKLFNKRRVS